VLTTYLHLKAVKILVW